MDEAQFLLVGLPLFLFFSDVINLFTPLPPKPPPHHHHQQPQPKPQSAPLDFPTQKESGIGDIDFGNTVNINFCSSCSYSQTKRKVPLGDFLFFPRPLLGTRQSIEDRYT
ncbi:selT-like protein isoform X3 [Vitis riparia]|uniref:selT-like protein isoform X3 n=1 Tax=Vitis riparia TaxID=96939 RepID=UPI00155AC126|nr:selT-like protein isoform X3 [Vitis riparia]